MQNFFWLSDLFITLTQMQGLNARLSAMVRRLKCSFLLKMVVEIFHLVSTQEPDLPDMNRMHQRRLAPTHTLKLSHLIIHMQHYVAVTFLGCLQQHAGVSVTYQCVITNSSVIQVLPNHLLDQRK